WQRAKAAYDSWRRDRATGSDPHRQPTGKPRSAVLDEDKGGDQDTTPISDRNRRWSGKRGLLGAAVMAALIVVAVVVGVAIQSRQSPDPQPTPSVQVWYAKVINTRSSRMSRDVGVFRYRSPIRSESMLPGLFTGDSVSIVCQYPNGRTVTDNTYHWTSQVW